MVKLILSLDDSIVERAKTYAKHRGISVSQLVEIYLNSVAEPAAPPLAPVLRSVKGIKQQANLEGYRKKMSRKYKS